DGGAGRSFRAHGQREGHPGRHRDVRAGSISRLTPASHDPGAAHARWATACGGPQAPIAQLAEADGLKPFQCRFESDWGHNADSVIYQPWCASKLAEPLLAETYN